LRDAIEHAPTPPSPVTEVKLLPTNGGGGQLPKLSAEAFELARQVYYLHHGNFADAARAVIAAGLSDTDNETTVRERLKTWWKREDWPVRSTKLMIALRDAARDGGLYRSERVCKGETTGNARRLAGEPCTASAIDGSDYCHQHDPRPEYVARRKRHAAEFKQARLWDFVPIEPLAEWLRATQARLLADARAEGRPLHGRDRGGGMLAEYVGVDQSLLMRVMDGSTNTRPTRTQGKIKARTAVRYLEGTGVQFRDVYGYDPPTREDTAYRVCPECGGRKDHEAKLCRECHETQGCPCSYVGVKSGRTCDTWTKHESGICCMHREIGRKPPRPKPGRWTWVSIPMLILATGEYRDVPELAWVGRKMWAANAGGCRDVFSSQKTFTGSLVKQFAKRGWRTLDDAQRAHDELVAEHGTVAWPDGDVLPLEAEGMIPFEPFRAWLIGRYGELGSFAQMAARMRTNPDNLSAWVRGKRGGPMMKRSTLDHVLEAWGDGTSFADLFETRST
jgi:hypothetical protein